MNISAHPVTFVGLAHPGVCALSNVVRTRTHPGAEAVQRTSVAVLERTQQLDVRVKELDAKATPLQHRQALGAAL